MIKKLKWIFNSNKKSVSLSNGFFEFVKSPKKVSEHFGMFLGMDRVINFAQDSGT